MILVTGATGFVGRHLVKQLRDEGHAVRCLVRQPESEVARELGSNGADLIVGDVTDEASIRRAMSDTRAVIHLVTILRERGAATYPEINYRGTLHVLDAAAAAGVNRVIHVSALGSDPASPYPFLRSIGLAGEAVRQSGLAFTILQPAVAFGEGDDFVRFLGALLTLSPIVPMVGNGRNLLQPIWVGDVVSAIVRTLADSQTAGRTYDLAGPTRLTFREIVEVVAVALKRHPIYLPVPSPAARPVVELLARVSPHPPVTAGVLDLLRANLVTNRPGTLQLLGSVGRPLVGNVDYVRHLTRRQATQALLGFGLP